MTHSELIEVLSKARSQLVSIRRDEGWQSLVNDERSHPDLSTDLEDAIHFAGEVIRNLQGKEL